MERETNPASDGDASAAPGGSDAQERTYAAFISYSHADEATAAWLHRALERFSLPKGLRRDGGRALVPIFRDRDDFASAPDLSLAVTRALTHSRALIVLCSPASAASRWVNEEIRTYKRLHGDGRIFAVIVDGVEDASVFPSALLERADANGSPGASTTQVDPLAADLRPGKDGKRLALLKLVAGVAGVDLDALRQRQARRERVRLTAALAAALGVAAVTTSLAAFALVQRDVARAERAEADVQRKEAEAQRAEAEAQRAEAETQRALAEAQSDNATAALDFLVSIFDIADPATENPDTITAMTILRRGRADIDDEFEDKPEVRARLLDAVGRVYYNLGCSPSAPEGHLRVFA